MTKKEVDKKLKRIIDLQEKMDNAIVDLIENVENLTEGDKIMIETITNFSKNQVTPEIERLKRNINK